MPKYYFNCHTKKSTKIQLGKNKWYFFPLCLYFSPLRLCNNCSTFTDGVLGGKYGKREIKSYFSRFCCDSICVFQPGENIWYFFPLRLYFSSCVFIFHLDHVIIVLLSQAGGVWGEIFFPSVSMFSPCVYVFPWPCCTFLPRQIEYELEEKQ